VLLLVRLAYDQIAADLLSRPILLWADYHDWAVRLFSDFGCRGT
jgi:hypothetical protein